MTSRRIRFELDEHHRRREPGAVWLKPGCKHRLGRQRSGCVRSSGLLSIDHDRHRGSASRRLHRVSARLAAIHLSRSARPCARRRRRGHRGDQAHRPSVLRIAGNICALQATRDHVNVFIYDPTVSDPDGIITSGHENKTARTVAVREGDTINQKALLAMFRAIIVNNRAGGWRKLGRGPG